MTCLGLTKLLGLSVCKLELGFVGLDLELNLGHADVDLGLDLGLVFLDWEFGTYWS